MAIELRLPNIIGKTPEEQLSQIKSYLYATVEQLNWALSTVEKTSVSVKEAVESSVKETASPDKAATMFGELKSLIIKDADIVSSYSEEMKKTFNSEYVAQSAFGDYQRSVTGEITTSAEGLRVDISKAERIATEAQNQLKRNSGYVEIGILEEDEAGNSVVGVEIHDESAGKKYARYTAKGTVLYGQSGKEAVVLSEGKTKLNGKVSIAGANASLSLGGFVLDPEAGLGMYWEGA